MVKMKFEKQFDEEVLKSYKRAISDHAKTVTPERVAEVSTNFLNHQVRNFTKSQISQALSDERSRTANKITDILEAHLWGDYSFSPSEVADSVRKLRDDILNEIKGLKNN